MIVDLNDARPDGARGERDILRQIEGVVGGAGADRLAAAPRGSVLDGGPGRDRLIGRGGDDLLAPGKGGARITCGRGGDTATELIGYTYAGFSHGPARIDGRTYLSRDCESLRLDTTTKIWPELELDVNPFALTATALRYVVSCPLAGEDLDEPQPCSGRIRLVHARKPHRLLASGQFSRGRWEDKPMSLRLTARGRKMLTRRAVWATMRTTGRNYPTASWTIRIGVP